MSNNVANITISFDAPEGFIEGALNRNTIAEFAKNKHITLFKNTTNNNITLNLAKLSHVDTAGLAWLLLLLETAKKANCQLTFVQIPEDLLKLAQLSAVDTFIRN